MKRLLNELEKYQYAEITDAQLNKIQGKINYGSKITIKWRGRNFSDVGYVFSTPYNDEDLDLLDLFVHVPKPDNEDGMGDAPQEWCHIKSLLINKDCLKIIVKV